MTKYLKILFSALCGRDPYKKELDKKAAEVKSYQVLIENLRQRLKEMDERANESIF